MRDATVMRSRGWTRRVDWITEQVAIGNHVEARDAELLRRQGVRTVLSLDGSLVDAEAEHLGVAAVVASDLIDGAGNEPGALGQAVAAREGLVRDCPPVLVHRHAGRSRSVVVAAGFLARGAAHRARRGDGTRGRAACGVHQP